MNSAMKKLNTQLHFKKFHAEFWFEVYTELNAKVINNKLLDRSSELSSIPMGELYREISDIVDQKINPNG